MPPWHSIVAMRSRRRSSKCAPSSQRIIPAGSVCSNMRSFTAELMRPGLRSRKSWRAGQGRGFCANIVAMGAGRTRRRSEQSACGDRGRTRERSRQLLYRPAGHRRLQLRYRDVAERYPRPTTLSIFIAANPPMGRTMLRDPRVKTEADTLWLPGVLARERLAIRMPAHRRDGFRMRH